jgi:hypothetical protein
MNLKTARRIAEEHGVNTKDRPFLISKPDANPKVAKNTKEGVMTAPLHLAPAKLSGYEVCPKRTDGCTVACLHTAGNPVAMEGKERARIAKTRLYFEHREAFLTMLLDDMRWLTEKARKAGAKAGLRLNATSDIPWERVKAPNSRLSVIDVAAGGFNIACYDYTKIAKRALDRSLSGFYHLTFSRTGENDAECLQVLEAGGNVAVVFAGPLPDFIGIAEDGAWVKLTAEAAKTFDGLLFRVINGDESDWRPGDPKGVIVGLTAKGRAKHDTSGFAMR